MVEKGQKWPKRPKWLFLVKKNNALIFLISHLYKHFEEKRIKFCNNINKKETFVFKTKNIRNSVHQSYKGKTNIIKLYKFFDQIYF